MTCNDCICSEVCYYKSFNDVRNLKKRRNDVEKICKSFVHRDSLKNAPTVDAVEVVHGRWEHIKDYGGGNCFGYCSHCKTPIKANSLMALEMYNKYCPWCGAKMDGDGNADV